MRVLAISDLHTDFKENWRLVEQIPDSLRSDDVLIVAGDIADSTEVIKRTLSLLRSKFKMVLYTPGNHELWVRNKDYDSVEKLYRILRLCHSLDVKTAPTKVNDIWIVPLFSWYDLEFDSDPADDGLDGWADFHFCKWPHRVRQVHEYFIEMNAPNIKRYDGDVISFSHFLPRIDLLPAKENLRFKGLTKVAGCRLLESQIRELKSIIHVFGHSHINMDCVIDGVRYVQNALSYPVERSEANLLLKEVWDFTTATQKIAPGGLKIETDGKSL
ncbi:MAG TPA: metallophosphoesterase [Blastocatellia bacterium]|nr:metallophosphoesterase [Blastocatellia bacterium]